MAIFSLISIKASISIKPQNKLKLKVFIRTPEEHDKQMAYIQGLTHLIARATNAIKIPDLELKTVPYHHLLGITETIKYDSLDLFLSIQKENPDGIKPMNHFNIFKLR